MEHNYYTEKKNAQRIEQENARIEAQNTEPVNKDFAKNPFSSVKESSQKVLQARDENEGKFGVKLRPEQYQAIIDYSNDGETIEEMERRRYTMAQALFYSNELGVSPEEAMENLDNYNRIVLGEYYNVDDYKTNWEAVQDCFNAGKNSLKIGDLGFEYYLNGRRPGADEYYKKQTDLLEQKNITYADANPNRPWYVNWFKAGAEMLPFTGKTLLLNAIPIIGPGLSTGYSMSQMTGTEYVQMRKDGADHETAFGVATASGILQGLVETGLGDAANYALNKTGLARFTGNFKQAIAKKVTQKVFTNTHYNRTLAQLGKAVVRAVENPFEEAAEEVMQNAISTLGKLVLKAIDEEYKPEDLNGWNFLEDSWEQGKSAFMGSFVFGLAMKPGQHVFSTVEAHKVVKAAESSESFIDFKNKVKDSAVFKGYEEGNERTTAMRQAFDFYQNRRDEAYYNINRLNDINEINQPAEGFEEDQYDETGELISNSEYRKDTGDLYTEDKVISSEDGITKGYYKVGNPTKGGKNSYGSINYTLDENTNTVTIDKFIMPKSRENIRGEFFRQFAKDYAGYNIEYDAVGEDAVKIRENLVNSNPSGVNNGLNYYTNETTKQDIKTRQNVASQIRKAMPRLNGTQVATHVALLEAMYKSLKEENGYGTFQDFIDGTFAEEMFGDEATLNQSANERNKKVRGGVSFKETSNGIRAVIYAGEHADFSTFAHEVSHVFRRQMQGELLKKAEEAFGVKDGKWTEAQEEAFAEGFEQFLRTGKCENKAVKPLFQKLAEFMARVYGVLKGHIQFAPGVEEVYNQLLKGGDGSELALAMKAVRANDRLIKQQEAEYTSNLEKEQAKVKEQEQFDASETTVNEDTEEEVKEEEPVTKDFVQEVKETDLIGDNDVIDPKKVTDLVQKIKQNSALATVEKQKASIESTLSNLENKKEIAEKITDPSTTLQNKTQITMEAAEEEKEEVIDLFQLLGTDTIRYIADKEMLQTILLNLKTAMDVDRKKMLGYTEEQKQRYIKSQTNWQKVNGKWLYEYSDDGMFIDVQNFKQALLQLKKEGLETFNKNNNLTVKNFVTDKGLFDMFPEIKDLRVKFVNTQASRFGSMYDSNSKTIAINLNHKDIKASFAAGIQRYLQSLTNDIDYRLIAELNSAYKEAIITAGIGKITGTLPFIDIMKCNNATVEFLQNELNARAMQVASRVHKTENEIYHTLLEKENDKSKSKVFFQSEIEDVRKQYENTDTWLKAPNGNDTHLDEKQWLQVRTPSFKKWFGDWENDPQNASQVVDENGEPQVVYHGTYNGKFHIFDKFNTDEYGLSGEGSMSFGYGTYVSGSEEIARDYAERQWDSKYGGSESQLKVFKHQLKEYKKDKENLSLESFTEQLQRELDNKKAYMPIFEERYKAGDFTDNDKRSAEYSLWKAEENLKNAEELYKEKVKEIDNKIEYYSNLIPKYEEKVRIIKDEDPKRNLYTVNIPDNDYIKWDQYVTEELINTVKEAVYNKLTTEPNEDGEFKYKGVENELKRELNDAFNNELTGEQLYNNVALYIGGEKNASKLLNRLGIPGIDYPAYSNFGNAQGKEARNYVIFNDDDAKIVEHILFQTMKELYDDARSCESWQDFMEFYESFGKPEPSLVPEDADAQWYQTTWEMANNLVPESQENEEIVKAQLQNDMESDDPALAKDALFMTKLERPGELESFLERIHDIMQMDLEMFADAQDEADAQERDQLMDMQNYIRTSLTHGSWLSNAGRISKGSPLTNKARKTLLSLIRNATRDYRDIYSTIMNDTEYAVEERDKVVNKLNQYRIADPDVDYSRQSPEQRARIANQMQNEHIAQKIKDGTLLMDGELEQYIGYLDGKIKEAESETRKKEKELQELHMDIQGDYQKLSDWETRRLLELHDDMLIARTKLTNHSNAIARRLNRGLAITGKYEQNAQNLKANYDSVYKKFDDLRKSIEISEEVKNALKERERVAELKDNIKGKQDEKKLVEKAKKMRINLVKRTMRRVPFDRINFDQARTLIAIQRTLEPNLLGGVNKWIGQDQAYLRGVISQWITDADAREKITKELTDKGTPSAMQLLGKLNQTETIEDFNNWTEAERKQAHRILPKENWIKELDLVKLAKEREQSIQLDIQEKTETKETTDENGKKTWLTRTSVILTPELESEIRAALGEKLFNQVMAVPFNEWTTEEMEDLAKRVDEIYIEGRNLLAAKRQAKKELADEIRSKIEQAVKDTGIVIESDDDDETKRKKQEQINKILGKNKTLAGTLENNEKGFFKSIKRILNGYGDANVLRVARVLDNWKEGTNVQELYRKEDYCYNAKARSIQARNENIERIMEANGITAEELMETVTVEGHEFTVDELLYMKAANMDYEEDTTKKLDPSDYYRLGLNDDYAPTSRNAVMFGNMLSSQEDLEFKEECRNKDLAMQKRIEADDLTADERNAKILNMLITKPGTRDYVNRCKTMFERVLYAADQLDPKYNALLDAINNDYSDQYDRMNKVSIEEFNSPINRVKQYVPLIRLESNGDTNENRVREDLLGAFGVGKQWVDKGMTQSRINIGPLNQKPVETGLYKTWTDSVERTEHFINYSPYVRELNAVYKSRDAQYLRGYIENRYGKDMIKYIDDYINEVANPNASGTKSELDKIVRTLRGKTAPAYLAWKASSVIKQAATSPWPFMAYVSPAKYLAASFDIMKSYGKIYDDIKSMSAFMNERVFDPMVDLVNEIAEKKTNPFNHAMNQFGKLGMKALEWIDWVCVAPGWVACFRDKYAEINGTRNAMYEVNKAKLTEENNMLDIDNPDRLTMEQINKKADKMTEDEVIRQSVEYADDCTRACQPSTRAVDLAPLFKAKGPNSEVVKALLQFQTALNVIWQNIRYDIPYAVKNKQYSRMVQTILGIVFAGILMNAIVNHPDDDEDEADKVRNFIWYSTTQFTDAIPVIGQMTSNLSKQLITGKKGYSSGNDIMPMLTKFYNSATSIRSGNWEKATRSFLEGVGMSQGLPVSGIKEALWAVGIGDGDGELKLRPDAFIGHRAKN